MEVISRLLSGDMADNPPIVMATDPRLANPQSATVAINWVFAERT